jgi:hypothetical protein
VYVLSLDAYCMHVIFFLKINRQSGRPAPSRAMAWLHDQRRGSCIALHGRPHACVRIMRFFGIMASIAPRPGGSRAAAPGGDIDRSTGQSSRDWGIRITTAAGLRTAVCWLASCYTGVQSQMRRTKWLYQLVCYWLLCCCFPIIT